MLELRVLLPPSDRLSDVSASDCITKHQGLSDVVWSGLHRFHLRSRHFLPCNHTTHLPMRIDHNIATRHTCRLQSGKHILSPAGGGGRGIRSVSLQGLRIAGNPVGLPGCYGGAIGRCRPTLERCCERLSQFRCHAGAGRVRARVCFRCAACRVAWRTARIRAVGRGGGRQRRKRWTQCDGQQDRRQDAFHQGLSQWDS